MRPAFNNVYVGWRSSRGLSVVSRFQPKPSEVYGQVYIQQWTSISSWYKNVATKVTKYQADGFMSSFLAATHIGLHTSHCRAQGFSRNERTCTVVCVGLVQFVNFKQTTKVLAKRQTNERFYLSTFYQRVKEFHCWAKATCPYQVHIPTTLLHMRVSCPPSLRAASIASIPMAIQNMQTNIKLFIMAKKLCSCHT